MRKERAFVIGFANAPNRTRRRHSSRSATVRCRSFNGHSVSSANPCSWPGAVFR